MSSHSSAETTLSNSINTTSSYSIEKLQSPNLNKTVKNFVSSVLGSAIREVKEKKKEDEKEIIHDFIDSLLKEVKIDIMTNNLIDSVFKEVSRKINIEEKNDIKVKKPSIPKENKLIPFSETKLKINKINNGDDLTLKKKGIIKNSKKKIENKSYAKAKRAIFTEYNSSTYAKADNDTLKKINTNKPVAKTKNQGSTNEQRNCSTKKKARLNINKKLDYKSTAFSPQYKAKKESDKEKKIFEEKLKIMKNHISAMKRRKEEMDKKISLLKQKESNINSIKKSKAILKDVLKTTFQRKVTELIKKRKNIEKQKEALDHGMKESFQKSKLEKMKNYEQRRKERQDLNNKLRIMNQQKCNNVKNLVEKIRILRKFNKNIAPQRKKKLNQNYQENNMLECEKNMEKTKLLKEQIARLQVEENEFIDKLNITKAKLNSFDSDDNGCFSFLKTEKKRKITSIIC